MASNNIPYNTTYAPAGARLAPARGNPPPRRIFGPSLEEAKAGARKKWYESVLWNQNAPKPKIPVEDGSMVDPSFFDQGTRGNGFTPGGGGGGGGGAPAMPAFDMAPFDAQRTNINQNVYRAYGDVQNATKDANDRLASVNNETRMRHAQLAMQMQADAKQRLADYRAAIDPIARDLKAQGVDAKALTAQSTLDQQGLQNRDAASKSFTGDLDLLFSRLVGDRMMGSAQLAQGAKGTIEMNKSKAMTAVDEAQAKALADYQAALAHARSGGGGGGGGRGGSRGSSSSDAPVGSYTEFDKGANAMSYQDQYMPGGLGADSRNIYSQVTWRLGRGDRPNDVKDWIVRQGEASRKKSKVSGYGSINAMKKYIDEYNKTQGTNNRKPFGVSYISG